MVRNKTLEPVLGLWRYLTQERHRALNNQSAAVWRMAGISGPMEKAAVTRKEVFLVAVTRTVPGVSPC